MTYRRPEIVVLGKTNNLVQQFVKDPLATLLEVNYPIQTTPINPAYDLDE